MAAGFRQDYSYLYDDPFAGTDLFPTKPKEDFTYTRFEIPQEEQAPIILPLDTSGGEDRDTRSYYNTPTGRVYDQGDGAYTYDTNQAFSPDSIQSDLAWGMANMGKVAEDAPWYEKLASAVMPTTIPNFLGEQMLSSQIDAIDAQYDRLTPPDLQPNNYNFNKGNQPQGIQANNLIAVTDDAGNVYYVEKGSEKEEELNKKALRNSLEYDLEKLGLENLKDFSIEELQDLAMKTSTGMSNYDYPSYDTYNTSMNNLYAANPNTGVIPAMEQAREELAESRGAGYDFSSGDGDYGGGTGQQTAGDVAGDSWGSSPFSEGGYVGPLGNRK